MHVGRRSRGWSTGQRAPESGLPELRTGSGNPSRLLFILVVSGLVAACADEGAEAGSGSGESVLITVGVWSSSEGQASATDVSPFHVREVHVAGIELTVFNDVGNVASCDELRGHASSSDSIRQIDLVEGASISFFTNSGTFCQAEMSLSVGRVDEATASVVVGWSEGDRSRRVRLEMPVSLAFQSDAPFSIDLGDHSYLVLLDLARLFEGVELGEDDGSVRSALQDNICSSFTLFHDDPDMSIESFDGDGRLSMEELASGPLAVGKCTP